MPRYRIHCVETRSRWLDVEAPSRMAVDTFYGTVDAERFHGGDDDSGFDWAFSELENIEQYHTKPTFPVDVTINADGEEIT